MPLPESLRPTWEALYNEVIAVHVHWIIYRQLFGESEHRINLLNASASSFFSVIQATLLDDVQLTLSKLADPAATGSKANATLERLISEMATLSERPLIDKLKELLIEFRGSCGQIKRRRNTQIAHYDHATLLQQYSSGSTVPLGPSRQEIEDALGALRRFMEPIESYLTSSATAYRRFVSRADGEALILVLQQGLRYQELQNNGVIPWDDLRNARPFGS